MDISIGSSKLTAYNTTTLPLVTTVLNTATIVSTSTVSRSDVSSLGFAGTIGAFVGFAIAFAALIAKVNANRSRKGELTPKYCTQCGTHNPIENAFCGGCGPPLDATRVYE
jgi:hypothetical protein